MTWWRAQRRALIALVITAAAVIGVHVWFDVLPAAPREPAAVAAMDGTAEVAGQTLRLGSVRWGEFEAPEGSRTLSIRLDSTGGDSAGTCGLFTLSEVRGERVWSNARAALDVPFEAGASYCQEGSAPYSLLAVFLLPDDVDGPFLMDVPGEEMVARFPVDP